MRSPPPMRRTKLQSDAEVQAHEPALVRLGAGHGVEQADARSDEDDGPEQHLAADVRHVGFRRERILPRAKKGRRDAEARAKVSVAALHIGERRAAGGESGLREQRDVARVIAPIALPVGAHEHSERRRGLLRNARVNAHRWPNVHAGHGVFTLAAAASLCTRGRGNRERRGDSEQRRRHRGQSHGAPHGTMTLFSRKRTARGLAGIVARSTGWVIAADTGHPGAGLSVRSAISTATESWRAPSITMSYPAVGRAPSAAMTTMSCSKSTRGRGGGG